MCEDLYKFIDNNSIPNDENTELIELNTRRGMDKFMSEENFTAAYIKYIKNKYTTNAGNELLTDKLNNLQAMRAFNVLYLDGDMTFKDSVDKLEYSNISIQMANNLLDYWCSELIDYHFDNYYYFIFIPNEFPKNKGGFHIFIFCNKIVPNELRLNMYNNIKLSMCEQEYQLYCNSINGIENQNDFKTNYEKIFDFGPLKTATLLLPFAQKDRSARTYKLYSTTFNYDTPQSWFVIPTVHRLRESLNDGNGGNILESNVSTLNGNVRDLRMDRLNKEKQQQSNNNEKTKSKKVTNANSQKPITMKQKSINANVNVDENVNANIDENENVDGINNVNVNSVNAEEEDIGDIDNETWFNSSSIASSDNNEEEEQADNSPLSLLLTAKRFKDLTDINTEASTRPIIPESKIAPSVSIESIEEINETINLLMQDIDKQSYSTFDNLGTVGRVVAEFMSSLIYLSPKHIFWNKLANNNERLSLIISPLIKFIYTNCFIENQGYLPDNKNNIFVHSLTKIMLPLLKMTTRNCNEKTQRDTYASCYSHINTYFNTYARIQDFTTEIQSFWKEYCNLNEKDKKKLSPEGIKLLNKTKLLFQKMIKPWITFIKDIIIAGMTDEIRPFKQRLIETDDPRRDVTFQSVMPKQASVNNNAAIEESFYTKTLRCWCTMFLYVETYSNTVLTESIRSILTAFSRYFIWYNKSISGNASLYIYNIKQTNMLSKYPYNQWLLDTCDGDCLRTWIKSLYLQFIKPELVTENKEFGIVPMLKNLGRAQLIEQTCVKQIKPFANFDQDMEKMYKNIISAFAQEHWDPPKEFDVASSNFFPMRNGILEFLDDGSVQMHYNNHSRFMNAYTNIIWSDNYNTDCTEFKKIQNMWREIFPDQEERDYSLKLFSSTLTGAILKDMFIIPYGTGGDGKTMSQTALLCVLGAEGLNSKVPIEEDGKIEYVENPNGLGTTMKTETVLVSNKSNHDSGGISQLKDKRFCTVQEPDPNLSGGKLNCARIKEILSGAPLTAREIYKKAEAFTPNCLITLQTNLLLAYTEDTDAIRRRVTVIPYRSKFTTEINKDKMTKLQYKFKADPQLGRDLVNNASYWQALFYTLLPYTRDLIRSSIKALSDIKRPNSIIKATNESFAHSNGLVGWINNKITRREGHALCITDLVSLILEDHNMERTKNGGILSSNNARERQIEIWSQLMGTFMGRIYKLKDCFYNKRKTDFKPGFSRITITEDDTDDTLIEKYFDEFAVNSLERSDLPNKDDMYIVGFAIKSNQDEGDDGEDEGNDGNDNEGEGENDRNDGEGNDDGDDDGDDEALFEDEWNECEDKKAHELLNGNTGNTEVSHDEDKNNENITKPKPNAKVTTKSKQRKA